MSLNVCFKEIIHIFLNVLFLLKFYELVNKLLFLDQLNREDLTNEGVGRKLNLRHFVFETLCGSRPNYHARVKDK